MLYTSTRDEKEVFTAARTLASDFAPDGGLFAPFRFPAGSAAEIRSLSELSFGENVARVLNLFFSAGLTGWDVDFTIGRVPVKLFHMNHRLTVAELWHNPGGDYAHMEQKLYERIRLSDSTRMPTDWAKVAIRTAVLFGVFSLLIKENIVKMTKPLDLAVSADDFTLPMAVWYGRKMGLPIGNVACGCGMNSGLWDLLKRGECNTGAVPEALRIGQERLIRETLGSKAAFAYSQKSEAGRMYMVAEEDLERLRTGIFAAVVGSNRTRTLSGAVMKSNGYRLSEDAVLAYGALQDYRSGITEGRGALILSDTCAPDKSFQ